MPLHRIDKQLVCRRFQRAAASYDRQALIQERMVEHLLELVGQHTRNAPLRVLEIGCGTGLLTRRLVQQLRGMKELVLNDLVPDFASRIHLSALDLAVQFLPGDIEILSLPGSFDLIISSSTLHWLHDLEQVFIKLATHLNSRGLVAFSLYGADNLQEIKELTNISLPCPTLPEIETLLCQHFTVLHSSEERAQLHFSNPQEVLRHLRQTGVNALSRSPWSRTKLEQFCIEYRHRFSTGNGVALTYHPLYCVACK